MHEYSLLIKMPKIKIEDPFKKYRITDEYIYSCIDEIAMDLKDYKITDYCKFEDDIDIIVKEKFPKLDEFINNYGIGVFGFLAQFRNEIKFKMEEFKSEN